MEIRSNRSFLFDSPPEAVWEAISDPSRFPGWWPWLRSFDSAGLSPGAVWNCEVKPPLPWTIRFDLVIGDVEPGSRVTATVKGDIGGTAHLTLVPHRHPPARPTAPPPDAEDIDLREAGAAEHGPDHSPATGSRLTLVSSLGPGRHLLAAAARVARPLVVMGHDWVIDTGASQFAERALHEAPRTADRP
jgi:uncharacterized protein YndB with AHSA1/START domain